MPDPNNDIKNEQIDDNFIKKKGKKEEETNKIGKKLIYPIFKFNNDLDKENRGKYYLNLIFTIDKEEMDKIISSIIDEEKEKEKKALKEKYQIQYDESENEFKIKEKKLKEDYDKKKKELK